MIWFWDHLQHYIILLKMLFHQPTVLTAWREMTNLQFKVHIWHSHLWYFTMLDSQFLSSIVITATIQVVNSGTKLLISKPKWVRWEQLVTLFSSYSPVLYSCCYFFRSHLIMSYCFRNTPSCLSPLEWLSAIAPRRLQQQSSALCSKCWTRF